jgi:hypothetical protein
MELKLLVSAQLILLYRFAANDSFTLRLLLEVHVVTHSAPSLRMFTTSTLGIILTFELVVRRNSMRRREVNILQFANDYIDSQDDDKNGPPKVV